MDPIEVEQLKKKYGLSYHINFALLAEEFVGLKGKRVLEVGGSLPSELAIKDLGAAQWLALEEPDYWDESLSTGLTQGTPPPLTGNREKLKDATPEKLVEHNLLFGRIEDLPAALHNHFDTVFSIAAFEHIAKLPQALDQMHAALLPGGKLFSLFSPIWSAHDGHHIPALMDKNGNSFDFGNPPFPAWAHLLMRPMEMYDHLMGTYDDRAFAQQVVYYVYSSSHINRFFLEDYIEMVRRSAFTVLQATPVFPRPVPQLIQEKLQALHPGRQNFSSNGVLLVLQKKP